MFDRIIGSPQTALSKNDLDLLEQQLKMNADLDPIFKSKALRNIQREKWARNFKPDGVLNSKGSLANPFSGEVVRASEEDAERKK